MLQIPQNIEINVMRSLLQVAGYQASFSLTRCMNMLCKARNCACGVSVLCHDSSKAMDGDDNSMTVVT